MKRVFSDCGDWTIYGNPEPKILIAGHSHTFSMFKGITEDPIFNNNFGLVAATDLKLQKPHLESYWNFVISRSNMQPIDIAWNGNQHNIHFLLKSGMQFNALGLDISPEFPIVPVSQIRELFKPTFFELELLLNKFPQDAQISLLGTPAPKSKKFLDKFLKSDPYFVEMGEKMGISKKDIEASSDQLRAYMWDFTQSMASNTAKSFDYSFYPSPEVTYDQNMILKLEYYASDLTHANDLFGEIMLNNLSNYHGIEQ